MFLHSFYEAGALVFLVVGDVAMECALVVLAVDNETSMILLDKNT